MAIIKDIKKIGSSWLRKYSETNIWFCVRLVSSLGILIWSISMCHYAQATASKHNIPFTTEKVFKKNVLQAEQLVFVEFSATWCPPCRTMAPAVEKLASKYAGKMKFYKVDIDDDEDLAEDLKVETVPTFMLINHGRIIKTSVGNIGSAKLDSDIHQALDPGTMSANSKTVILNGAH